MSVHDVFLAAGKIEAFNRGRAIELAMIKEFPPAQKTAEYHGAVRSLSEEDWDDYVLHEFFQTLSVARIKSSYVSENFDELFNNTKNQLAERFKRV
jgi:hypothetical protein